MAKSLPPVELDLLSTLKKEGRTSLQEIGLKHIKPDMKYQCRVEMNLDHVRLLQGMMEGGEGLDAIVVFQCVRTKKYILADGFHRYEAHKRMKLDSIRAYVIQSEAYDEEATRFAASANLKRTLLTVNDADKKKAMEAMLKFAKYREWSAAMLGRECGVGANTAQKWKIDFLTRNDILLPPVVLTSDGRKQLVTWASPGQIKTRFLKTTKSGEPRYTHRVGRTYVGLTSTPQPDGKVIEAASKTNSTKLAKWMSDDQETLRYLAARGFPVWVVPGTERIGRVLRLRDIAFTSLRQDDYQSLRAAALLLLWQSLASPGIARLRVVATVSLSDQGSTTGPFRSLGVQFVTPEEFFAELAADDADGTATTTTKPTPSPRPTTGATSHATL